MTANKDVMKLILGTMTFGPQVDAAGSRAMVQRFLEAGYQELDTAYVYNEGATERILGEVLSDMAGPEIRLATKVNPRITGRLDAEAVTLQLNQSLHRLKREQVDILYFHFPDPVTPIESALEASAEYHRQGKFKELGLSNFPAWMVVDIWHLCARRGWLQPTVYQCMYNGLSRKPEAELFPALRRLGMRCYAYNPLAGGMLTGKHTDYAAAPQPGRFARLQSYRDRYWNKSYFDAVSVLASACRAVNIQPAEAAYRWLTFHSFLDPTKGDGILVGASSLVQLDQNLSALRGGPLPASLLGAFNQAWEDTRLDSPEYYNFLGGLKASPTAPL